MALLSSLFFLTWNLCAWADDVVTAEKQTRCLSYCIDYNKNATMLAEIYSCKSTTCSSCADPCRFLLPLSECRANCKKRSSEPDFELEPCLGGCDFVANMGDPTKDKNLLPAKPGKPRLRGTPARVDWSKDGYEAYNEASARDKGIVFLLLGSRAILNSDGSVDQSQLDWRLIRHFPDEEFSADVEEIEKYIKLHCRQSYVFKVAAFNELGTLGYKMSNPYKTEDLSSEDTCKMWYPFRSGPPAYCPSVYSFNRTLLNVQQNNSQMKDPSLYGWNNDGCSDMKASRVVIWIRPNSIGYNEDFCYEVHMVKLADQECGMENRVYYVASNETELLLEDLLPNCNVFLSVFAGTLKRSRIESGDVNLDLNLKIPRASPTCDARHQPINFTVLPYVFNETSKLYEVVFTWKKGLEDTGSFKLTTQLSSQLSSRSVSIKASKSSDHLYTYQMNVKPELCFITMEIQPFYNGRAYLSATLEKDYCTPSLLPSAPTDVNVTGTATSATVYWKKPAVIHDSYQVVGYALYWTDTEDVDSTDVHVVSASVTKYTVSGLLPNHLYRYRVSAISSEGNSSTEWKSYRTDGLLLSSSDHTSLGLIVGPVCALVVVIILIAAVSICIIRCTKKKYEYHLNQLELDTFHPPILSLPTEQLDSEEEPDEWEIEPRNLNLVTILGEGFFGMVLKAEVYFHELPVDADILPPLGTLCHKHEEKGKGSSSKMESIIVACKMLKEVSTIDDLKDLLEEIKLMKKIAHHKHVVSMLGCITLGHPVCLIVEYCEHGDLLEYLRSCRPAWLLATKKRRCKELDDRYSEVPHHLREMEGYVLPTEKESASTPVKQNANTEEAVDMEENFDIPTLTPFDLLSFAHQIALGMEYLADKGLVHRDLACRNILVDKNNVLKISDFGLTRAVYHEAAYTQKRKGRLPLKWMAVESVIDRVFTTQSDIWSYGIVLWEICTLGGFPYPTISNDELLRRLRNGYRMERPENCSEELYAIMLQCWHPDPSSRPSFSSLAASVDEMMDSKANCFVNLNFDAHSQYWMSISELDSDSDTESEAPFQDLHLRQVSFTDGSFSGSSSRMASGSSSRVAKQFPSLAGVDEDDGEVAVFTPDTRDANLFHDDDSLAQNGCAKALNGDVTARNGSAERCHMNGHMVHVAGHKRNSMTTL